MPRIVSTACCVWLAAVAICALSNALSPATPHLLSLPLLAMVLRAWSAPFGRCGHGWYPTPSALNGATRVSPPQNQAQFWLTPTMVSTGTDDYGTCSSRHRFPAFRSHIDLRKCQYAPKRATGA